MGVVPRRGRRPGSRGVGAAYRIHRTQRAYGSVRVGGMNGMPPLNGRASTAGRFVWRGSSSAAGRKWLLPGSKGGPCRYGVPPPAAAAMAYGHTTHELAGCPRVARAVCWVCWYVRSPVRETSLDLPVDVAGPAPAPLKPREALPREAPSKSGCKGVGCERQAGFVSHLVPRWAPVQVHARATATATAHAHITSRACSGPRVGD